MHATSNVDFAFCSLLLSMRKVSLTLPSSNLGLNLFFHTRHSVLGVFPLWSLRSTGGGGLEVLDVWSWISTVCCSPLKGSWDRFACCLVVVKKGSHWFLMFSLIAKLRTYCECDHITIMTPCSAKVLLYLKTRNLVTLWFQFADRVVWWVEEFFIPFSFVVLLLSSPLLLIFYSRPSPLCLWPKEGSLGSRSWVSVGPFHAALLPLLSSDSSGGLGCFSSSKSCVHFFPSHNFASFACFSL